MLCGLGRSVEPFSRQIPGGWPCRAFASAFHSNADAQSIGVKAALHRSITFWSGILAMSFICWAWWDSTHSRSMFAWGNFSGSNEGSCVCLMRCTDRLGLMGPRPSGLSGERGAFLIDPKIQVPALPEPVLRHGGNMDLSTFFNRTAKDRPITYQDELRQWMAYQAPGDWLILIPHWLSLLAVAALWTGLLIWRGERRMRAAASLTN